MASEETLLDLTPSQARDRLAAWVAAESLPAFRVDQIHRRLWLQPVGAWSEAMELPKALREQLTAVFPLPRITAEVIQQSADGTIKFLWHLRDGERVESVLIPTEKRRTLCVSSQAGCALGCVFCATGEMGFSRNLTPSEIALQAREIVLRNPKDKPSNIVFMGMGEPLLNWPSVDVALSTFNDPQGFGIGARHITVSTVGIIPGMKQLAARKEQFRLAISLHHPEKSARLALMPIEKKYPLQEVLATAKDFAKRVTFEYVMIAGENDRDADAMVLASRARRLGAHVNLLPLHPGGRPGLRPSPAARIREFRQLLQDQGIEAVVRRSRGLDIDAACGQLRVKTERRPA